MFLLWNTIFHHINLKQAVRLAHVRMVSSKRCQWGKDDLFTASDRRLQLSKSRLEATALPLWKRWICCSCRRESHKRILPCFSSRDLATDEERIEHRNNYNENYNYKVIKINLIPENRQVHITTIIITMQRNSMVHFQNYIFFYSLWTIKTLTTD